LTRQASQVDLKLDGRPTATRELRAAVERVAEECGLDPGERFDLKLAATEAVTNALKGTPERHAVDVTVAGHKDTVDVEVVDQGVFSPVRAALPRGPDSESGRGIPIILALVDEVEFAQTGRGTRVRMSKRAAAADKGPAPFGNGDSFLFG
jgi:serine/threonine-protein kinase RsbW